MANNEYVNKVQFGDTTVIDISDTTADSNDVIEGEVFYTKSGARSTGTLGDATQSTHGLMSTTDKIKLDGIDTMIGATASTVGIGGLVPTPTTVDVNKFLAGDGTWKDGGMPMVILSYGHSTWQDFINAYNNNVIVYCRASSNSNPATGSQTRMAFMAYVSDASNPTNVEFQYYRSMSSHSATAMGDEVYVYKLTNANGGTWSVTTRKASIKEIAVASGSKLGVSWSSDKVTLSNTMTANDMPMSSSDSTTVKTVIDDKADKTDTVLNTTLSRGRKANTVVGDCSLAFGYTVTASGNCSQAEGYLTVASGTYSHAEGQGGSYTADNILYTSEAAGVADHTEGYMCRTDTGNDILPGNHAEGFQTSAVGGASHSEGEYTIASGIHSHSEGGYSTASGQASHAEGNLTIASGNISHAEGSNTTASALAAHAEGRSSTASGYDSHAEGNGTTASGTSSHSEGIATIASGYASHAGGQFNISNSDHIEIIGNGTQDNERSNARALDYDGNEYLAGDLYVGCDVDSTGGTKVATVSNLSALIDDTATTGHTMKTWSADKLTSIINGDVQISQVTLTGQSTQSTGGAQANVGSTISFSSSSAYHYESYDVDPTTDISLTVTTKQSNSANYPYFIHFVDSNNTVLSAVGEIQSSEQFVTYTDVPVPSNATKVYLTSLGSTAIAVTKKYRTGTPGLADIVTEHDEMLDDVLDSLNVIETNIGEIEYKNVTVTNKNIVQGGIKGEAGNSLTTTVTSGYHNVTLDVDPDAIEYTIKIKQSTSSNYAHYYWFLNENNVILVAGGTVKTTAGKYTYTQTTPTNAVKLVVLTADSSDNIQITMKKIITMSGKVNAMENYFNKKGLSTSPYADTLKDAGRVAAFEHNFSSKLLNFAFITDTHFGGNRYPDYDARNNIKAFVEMSNERWLDFAAHGGDIITDYGLTRDEAIKWIDDTMGILGDIQIPLFITKGNHETNNAYYSPVSDYSNLDWSNTTYYVRSDISFQEITQAGWDGEEDLYVANAAPERISDVQFSMLTQLNFTGDVERNNLDYMGGYFYKDFDMDKIRVIVLDEYQIRGSSWVGMSAEQLAWLGSTALNLGTKTDFSVMIISHSPNIPADVLGLILAYKNGTSYTISGTAYDFTSQGAKPFIMYLHGHEHTDTIDTTDGINNIGVIGGFVSADMTETEDEIRFSIFSIDTANRKIYETRIGSGNSREFTY